MSAGNPDVVGRIVFNEQERRNIASLARGVTYAKPEDLLPAPPEPGERCALCNRRRNKPRQDSSPDTKEIRIKLPVDRMEPVEEAFDGLQELTGVDPYSYPKGTLLEALLLLGSQHREELREYFQAES